ncbi:MAG TPA: LysE family translocator [Hyphomicrobiaceae bacterium]|jgi:threonine/homoserine/homoserine lactone efflux protein
MPFLPDASVLLAFSLACLVLFVTPGPDMSLFLARTVAGGRAAGIAAFTGASLGCVVHSLLAAFGLSALIAASPTAFLMLKVVGALYLLWLAVDAVRNGSSLNVRAEPSRRVSFWPTLALGLTVNLTNPKVVLFFVTFLPQFVDASDPHAAAKLLFLGIYFVVATFPLGVLMILGAERVVGALKSRPRVLRAIDWLFAGVFSAFAVRILTTQGR